MSVRFRTCIFDFQILDKPIRERELEAALVEHLERFLLEPGAGFAFVGRQVHRHLDEEDVYIPQYLRCYLELIVEAKSHALCLGRA